MTPTRTRAKILIVAPRFFDRVYGERRAMMSAYKTALALSKHADVVVVTAGPPPRREALNPHLVVYRLWDLFIPDPVNYGIVPGLLPSLWSIIRAERPDAFIINKHMFFTSLAAPLLRLLGYRTILQTDTFPGIVWFPRNQFVRVVMQCYAWTIGLFVLKSAHHTVLLHEGLEPTARQLRIPHSVIHNGVDLEMFRRAQPAPDLTKRQGDIFIGYVGRLESVKGYDDFLAVAQRLAPQHPRVTFFFIGSTDGREELIKRSQSKQIVFLGHRSDVPAVLKQLDIFVLPSYSEGLPNALMEAMAAGCVPVASNVGGVQILLRDGAGLLFEPGDQAQLTTHLEQLIGTPALRTKIRIQAQQRIADEFDLNREAEKLLRLALTVSKGNDAKPA